MTLVTVEIEEIGGSLAGALAAQVKKRHPSFNRKTQEAACSK